MVHGRGNTNNAIMDQLRQIVARLDVVEIAQRRGVHLEDVSNDEVAAPNHNPKPEEDQDEEKLLQLLSMENSKPVVVFVLPHFICPRSYIYEKPASMK